MVPIFKEWLNFVVPHCLGNAQQAQWDCCKEREVAGLWGVAARSQGFKAQDGILFANNSDFMSGSLGTHGTEKILTVSSHPLFGMGTDQRFNKYFSINTIQYF